MLTCTSYLLLKRFFAISLLLVHLFNLGGYALVYAYFINQADVQMVKQLYSSNINDAKLIELKIPVHMPTVENQTEYEVVTGQIQLKDAYYDYVKLRMTRDTMYFVCLPNKAKTQLVKANLVTAKEIADVPLNKKADPAAKKVNSISEYNLQTFSYQYTLVGINVTAPQATESSRPNNPYIESPGKPPNSIS